MKFIGPELTTIAFFVVFGWIALWPSRNRLGASAYHIAALPIGLLASSLALVVSSTSGRPLDIISALTGGVLLVVIFWLVQRVVLTDDTAQPASVTPVSFAVATGAMALVGLVAGVLRFTVTNYDSVVSFWPLAVRLTRDGAIVNRIAASRSPLIPSMDAIHIVFGSSWAYVIYPMLAVGLIAWLLLTLAEGPLSAPGFGTGAKRLVLGGSLAFLVLEPSYLFDAVFVHSHLISAIYLLMALTGIWMVIRADKTAVATVYLIVAGASAAGLALTRPDGLAYQFVPVVMAIGALTISKLRWRDVAAFFAPLLSIELVVYGAIFLKLGVWKADKLSGAPSLAILVILAVSSAGPWIIQSLQRHVSFRVTGERFLGIAVSAAAVLMVAAFVLKRESASTALKNAAINLFLGAGGYNYLWYGVVALLVLAVLSGDALRYESWTRAPFLATLLFFVIAGLVHGTSHEGRIGVGDSFNRVAFQVLPVIVWFVAATAARILAPSAEEDGPASEPEIEPDWEAA